MIRTNLLKGRTRETDETIRRKKAIIVTEKETR